MYLKNAFAIAIALFMLTALVTGPINAASPVITSFQGNGELTWASSTDETYRMEWASDLLTGLWYRDWWDLNRVISAGTETTVSVPMFYRVVHDTTTYDNTIFDTPWFLRAGEKVLYFIGDGAGTIDDVSFFNIDDPMGLYDIFSDGSLCMIFPQGASDPNFGLIGQLITLEYGEAKRPSDIEIIKVTDLSLCQGSWSGTLDETYPVSQQKSISFNVSSTGVVTSVTGLAPPVTGYMFAISDGTLVCFLRTGELDGYNQVWLTGDLSGNSATGYYNIDLTGDDPNGTFSLAR